jgi:hypothetical protein
VHPAGRLRISQGSYRLYVQISFRAASERSCDTPDSGWHHQAQTRSRSRHTHVQSQHPGLSFHRVSSDMAANFHPRRGRHRRQILHFLSRSTRVSRNCTGVHHFTRRPAQRQRYPCSRWWQVGPSERVARATSRQFYPRKAKHFSDHLLLAQA